MWRETKEVTYHCTGESHCISMIPGVDLTASFWQEAEKLKARPSYATVTQQLIVHEIRMRPGLVVRSWLGHLKMECPENCNPRNNKNFMQLPINHLELAMLGRLMDWKLCTVEIYADKYWLHFYNIRYNEWQSGILYDADRGADETARTPPNMLEIITAEGEQVLVHRGNTRNDDSGWEFASVQYCNLDDGKNLRTATVGAMKVTINGMKAHNVTEHIPTNVYESQFNRD